MGRRGLSHGLEVGLSYEHVDWCARNQDWCSVEYRGHTLTADITRSIVDEYLAISFPVGGSSDDGYTNLSLQAVIMARLPIFRYVSVELAGRIGSVITLSEPGTYSLGLGGNLGLRIGDERFAIHPEISLVDEIHDNIVPTKYRRGYIVLLIRGIAVSFRL